MTCPNCSKWLPSATRYCDGCGYDFQPTTNEAANEKYPHPYHHLGGWLAFWAYSQLIALGFVIIITLRSISQLSPLMPLLRLIDPSLATRITFAMVINVVHVVIVGYLTIKYFLMIKRREAKFFRYFEIEVILAVCMYLVVLIILPGFDSQGILQLLASVAGIAIWFTYFSKSVRVRTYFGSDEYLRRSIFLKEVSSPEPADTRPYAHM